MVTPFLAFGFRSLAAGSTAVAALLLAAGCETPRPKVQASQPPNVGPPLTTDVRTQATILAMENQYIADKNDQPTRQHEAEAKKKKKEAQARARAAEEQARQAPAPEPAPGR